jgi:hypothetical protein
MKKILLAIVMIFMLSSPAVADAPVNVIVNGKMLDTPGLIINDRTYVPLRAVSEGLGAQVDWDGTQVIVTSVKEPVITGDNVSASKVNEALDLLKSKTPADYEMVCRYTNKIEIFSKTINAGSVYAWTSGNGEMAIGPEIIAEGTIPLAAVLVHEASHIADNKYAIIYKQTTENNAFLHQIAVLRILGTPQSYIDAVEQTRLRVIK